MRDWLEDQPQAAARLDEARRRLHGFFAATASAAIPGAEVTEAPGTGRVVGCEGPGGAPSGLVQVDVNLDVALDESDGREVVETVARLWEQAGLDPRRRHLDSEVPAVFAGQHGYTVSVEVLLSGAVVHLRGSTPCLPPED